MINKAFFLIFLFWGGLLNLWAENNFEMPATQIEVREGDRLVIRGFEGEVRLRSHTSDRVILRARQQNAEDMPVFVRQSLEEWRVSIQRQENEIEVVIQSPQSKQHWTQFLSQGGMPSFVLDIAAPSIPLEVSWRKGRIRLENWEDSGRLTLQEGEILVRGGKGDLQLFHQEGLVDVKGRTGQSDIETYSGRVLVSGLEGRLQLENFMGESVLTEVKGVARIHASRGSTHLTKGSGRLEFDNGSEIFRIEGFDGDVRGQSAQGAIVAQTLDSREFRVTTQDAPVTIQAPPGANINVGTEEGALFGPNSLSRAQTANLRLMRGQVQGTGSARVFVRTGSGAIRVR